MRFKDKKAFIKSLEEKGWVESGGVLYNPQQVEKMGLKKDKVKRAKVVRSCDDKDSRNLKNKLRVDEFVRLMDFKFGYDVWSEFYFCEGRMWRFDYAFYKFKVAIEVEGGIWSRGRHVRPKGYLGDMEKYNKAAELGWLLIRVEPKKLMSNEFLDKIKGVLDGRLL